LDTLIILYGDWGYLRAKGKISPFLSQFPPFSIKTHGSKLAQNVMGLGLVHAEMSSVRSTLCVIYYIILTVLFLAEQQLGLPISFPPQLHVQPLSRAGSQGPQAGRR
jgi:hypothetical protein